MNRIAATRLLTLTAILFATVASSVAPAADAPIGPPPSQEHLRSRAASRTPASFVSEASQPYAVAAIPPEPAAALAHHLGNTETAADFYGLTAGNDYFFPFCQCAQSEENSRCIVIDHQRGFGAGQTEK